MTVHPTAVVFLYALITALATGIGAVPFALFRRVSQGGLAHANAVASGLMLGASFGLVVEGTRYGDWQTVLGAVFGVLFILLTQRLLGRNGVAMSVNSGTGARRMVLMLAVMTVHSFAEGVAVGVAFGGDMRLALVIVLAVAVHNIPEGIAITAVLRPQGMSLSACALWSVASSLPQPVMAVPAFLLVETFTEVLPYGVGFAAGAMVFMVLEELLPEAYGQGRKPTVAFAVSVTLLAMAVFQRLL